MSRRLRFALFLTASASLVYWACGGDSTAPPEDPRPTGALAVSGDQQTGVVGQQLPVALVVQINDQDGDAMSGVSVSFAVTQGGGSVSVAAGTTAGNGQASTSWTLGTTAGAAQEVRASVSSASNVGATFTATAEPDVAAVISADSGDNQQAFRGTKLSEYIVVLVRDQYANAVPNQIVQFLAPGGSGTVDSAAAFTDATGRARTGWTLGTDVGEDTAQAVVEGLIGSPVTFTATAHNLNIESVTPDPAAWGATATITGTGFDPTPANNVVTVSGEVATVTTASATQLDITVPSVCLPAGSYDFQVNVGALISAPVAGDVEPAAFLTMAVGEQVILQDPGDLCLQFAETVAAESYLFGVQSVSEVASSRTPAKVTSVMAPGAVAAPPAAAVAAPRSRGRALSPEAARRVELLRRHRMAETRILAQGLQLLEARRASVPRAAGPAQVPPVVQVGDTLNIRVPTGETASCDSYVEITTVAREVGTRAVWLEDVANPAGGFTTADFQSFSDLFDDTMYGADVAYFGQPSDIDGNSRVAVVVTKEVNLLDGPAGFVAPLDFLARADCAASDEGELTYIWAPDPNASLGYELSLDAARDFMPTITAHEFVHIIQVGRRRQAGAALQTLWELEGQASMGEEVVGHAVEGNSVAQNLPWTVALDPNLTATSPWYQGGFIELMYYYGGDIFAEPAPVKLPDAPEDCTWLARIDDHACFFSLVNGPPWSFLRWISDHYGPGYAGGEQGLQSALVDNTLTGFANIEDVVGQSIDTLLARWAAMLYLDDRVLDGAPVVTDSILTMRSWDMYDVFDRTLVFGSDVHRLEPDVQSFSDFSTELDVRAASSAYFIVSGDGRAATAIRARDADDNPLPQHMQVWVVRMK
ncbi:MAG: IPT/TIG domain-containing protein [Gemmatimonadota bacterium]|nr:MAG: IPT/TIG domain-containing protein [Gemmatimonadota bacterium]